MGARILFKNTFHEQAREDFFVDHRPAGLEGRGDLDAVRGKERRF